MPIFEYKCTECNKKFEELVFGSQTVVCPECKSDKVEKQISSFSSSGSSSSTASCNTSSRGCGSSGFS